MNKIPENEGSNFFRLTRFQSNNRTIQNSTKIYDNSIERRTNDKNPKKQKFNKAIEWK